MYIAEFEFGDEEKEAMRDIANKAVWSDLYLTGRIGSIVSEESAYYFNGDKSAEEVADIIQSRESLYMEE